MPWISLHICMNFNDWLTLNEENLPDLYTSTVRAFPRTTKRQNAIDEIDIMSVLATPYRGVRTLLLRGHARNDTNGREYSPIMLFKGVRYRDSMTPGVIEIASRDGRRHMLERLGPGNDVLVRCDCQDFYWRFNYEDRRNGVLWGRPRRKYEASFNPGSSNPLELPGMCKHLIKMARSLGDTGIMEG